MWEILLTWVSVTGAEQQPPLDVVFVLDRSGSMKRTDPQRLMGQAVNHLVGQLKPGDNAGLILFGNNAQALRSLDPLATDKQRKGLLAQVAKIRYVGSRRNIAAGIERGLYEIKTKGRPDSIKTLVFMTGGALDTGSQSQNEEMKRWLRNELLTEAQQRGVRIFSIALTEQADFSLIQEMASKTGGEYFRAMSAQDIAGTFNQVTVALRKLTQGPAANLPIPGTETAGVSSSVVPGTVSGTEPSGPGSKPIQGSVKGPESTEVGSPTSMPGVPVNTTTATTISTESNKEPSHSSSSPVSETNSIQNPPKELESTEQNKLNRQTPGWFPDVVSLGEQYGFPPWLIGSVTALVVLLGVLFTIRRSRRSSRANIRKSATGHPDDQASVKSGSFPSTSVKATSAEPPSGRSGSDAVAMPSAKLIDLKTGNVIVLDKPVIRIGRQPDNDVVIYTKTISGHHAQIEFREGKFYVQDLQSTNGTFVNQKKVEGEMSIKTGDIVRFDQTSYRFMGPEPIIKEVRHEDPGDETKTLIQEANFERSDISSNTPNIPVKTQVLNSPAEIRVGTPEASIKAQVLTPPAEVQSKAPNAVMKTQVMASPNEIQPNAPGKPQVFTPPMEAQSKAPGTPMKTQVLNPTIGSSGSIAASPGQAVSTSSGSIASTTPAGEVGTSKCQIHTSINAAIRCNRCQKLWCGICVQAVNGMPLCILCRKELGLK
jgi:pSer/pThr/pTyr-binding forkhead associated (FHA) protein/Mg-chelatase subunit ChlD